MPLDFVHIATKNLKSDGDGMVSKFSFILILFYLRFEILDLDTLVKHYNCFQRNSHPGFSTALTLKLSFMKRMKTVD